MELTSIIILESHQPGLFFHVVLKFNLLQQAAGFGAQYDESDWDGITRSSRIAVVQVNAWKIGGNMQDIISISDKILQKTTFRNRPQMLVATSTLFLSPYCWFCLNIGRLFLVLSSLIWNAAARSPQVSWMKRHSLLKVYSETAQCPPGPSWITRKIGDFGSAQPAQRTPSQQHEKHPHGR